LEKPGKLLSVLSLVVVAAFIHTFPVLSLSSRGCS
jgi:hypothetical protein